jgi:hypothetical protein
MNDRAEGSEKKQSIRPITERKSGIFERDESLTDEFTVTHHTSPAGPDSSAIARESSEVGYDFLADLRRPRRFGVPSAGGSPINSAVQIEVTNFLTP